METVDYYGTKVPATYLGDAVYVLYDIRGYVLRVNDHKNTEGQIYLELPVLDALIAFTKRCTQLREEDERKESENLANPNATQEG